VNNSRITNILINDILHNFYIFNLNKIIFIILEIFIIFKINFHNVECKYTNVLNKFYLKKQSPWLIGKIKYFKMLSTKIIYAP